MQEPICPIWGTKVEVQESLGDSTRLNSWRAGGTYKISGTAEAILRSWGDNMALEKAALSQAILEARLNGGVLNISSSDLREGSNLIRARTHKENFWLFLKTVSELHPMIGEEFFEHGLMTPEVDYDYAIALAWEALVTDDRFYSQIMRYIKYGERQGLIEIGEYSCALTFEGYELVESLGLSGSEASSIFVAMWFGSEATNQYYELAVKPAVEAAGYKCVRIDQEHHNERIDEQILAEIRKSKAVLVDVTCGLAAPKGWSKSLEIGAPRGGVYFEAGFAAGLGKPIIWCVQQSIADIENVVHFDVRQYNQIRWGSDHEKNREFLQARIEATLGPGKERPQV